METVSSFHGGSSARGRNIGRSDNIIKNINAEKRKNKNKKKRKKNKQNKMEFDRNPEPDFTNPIMMASWVQSIARSVTWQKQHEVSFWKAKATALEYENNVLHDIIRKYQFSNGGLQNFCFGNNAEVQNMEVEHDNVEQEDHEEENEEEEEEEEEEESDENEFVVSDEFVQFLVENAKYREDARREREKFKAKQKELEEKAAEDLESVIDTPEERIRNLKVGYGEKWVHISSLEMAVESDFVGKVDNLKPPYWPNIPFNFS